MSGVWCSAVFLNLVTCKWNRVQTLTTSVHWPMASWMADNMVWPGKIRAMYVTDCIERKTSYLSLKRKARNNVAYAPTIISSASCSPCLNFASMSVCKNKCCHNIVNIIPSHGCHEEQWWAAITPHRLHQLLTVAMILYKKWYPRNPQASNGRSCQRWWLGWRWCLQGTTSRSLASSPNWYVLHVTNWLSFLYQRSAP